MQKFGSWLRVLPLAIGVIILAVIAFVSPWDQINDLVRRIDAGELGVLIGLSVIYYWSKAVRFWLMLRFLHVSVPMRTAVVTYLAAQPVTILPAGELYRSVLLQRYAGVPLYQSSPTVTVQGLVEAILLLGAALAGAVTIGHHRAIILASALVLAVVLFGLRRGWLKDRHRTFNRLPFLELSRRYYNDFVLSHQRLLHPRVLAWLLLASVLPVVSGVAMLVIAARAIDSPVGWAQAGIAYSLPVVLSGISFLPGGVGASEGSSIGLLRLVGTTGAAAVTITLIVRVFTLGAGVLYGFIAMGVAHLTETRSDEPTTH